MSSSQNVTYLLRILFKAKKKKTNSVHYTPSTQKESEIDSNGKILWRRHLQFFLCLSNFFVNFTLCTYIRGLAALRVWLIYLLRTCSYYNAIQKKFYFRSKHKRSSNLFFFNLIFPSVQLYCKLQYVLYCTHIYTVFRYYTFSPISLLHFLILYIPLIKYAHLDNSPNFGFLKIWNNLMKFWSNRYIAS
jgi:hypothetical protein